MSVEPAHSAQRATRERVTRLTKNGPALIDRGGIGRGTRILIGALTVTPLEQVRGCLPHLHEPQDQRDDDDDGAELTGPRTGFPGGIGIPYRTRSAVMKGS